MKPAIKTKLPFTKVLLAGALVLLPLIFHGQITFNKRYPVGLTGLGTGVLVSEQGYYVHGMFLPAEGDIFEGLSMSLFSFEGEVQWHKLYGEVGGMQMPQTRNANCKIDDEHFAVAGQNYFNDTLRVAVYWFNAQGDTLLTVNFISPYYNASVSITTWIDAFL